MYDVIKNIVIAMVIILALFYKIIAMSPRLADSMLKKRCVVIWIIISVACLLVFYIIPEIVKLLG